MRTASRSVVVTSEYTGYAGFAWLRPIVGPLGTAWLVLVTVIVMLLERRDLRGLADWTVRARRMGHHHETD